ncbi:MAG: hypothetical protein JSR67_11555 [Proteobacteria bacterium]|nr:hypothetical protein [Pseudomonadota bacterium]
MKRREFLTAAASAGIAAGVLPRRAAAEAQPGAAAAGAPPWFQALPEGQWVAVADGSGHGAGGGHMITQVLPSPLPEFPGLSNNPTAIAQVWTGAFLDQGRLEYGFCATGGHADYCGNETYVLALSDPKQPGWRRLTTPSPSAAIAAASPPLNSPSGGDSGPTYGDGYSRAMHNSYQAYLDGRVWMAVQNSVACASGGGTDITTSFNRDALGEALTPVSYANSNVWAFHGHMDNPWNYYAPWGFGFSVADKVNHRVWALPAYAYDHAAVTLYGYINTSGSHPGTTKSFSTGQGFGGWRWAACADDLQILIAGDAVKQRVAILNLSRPGAGWVQPDKVSGTGLWGSPGSIGPCPGAVYDAANHCVYVADPPNSGDTRAIYRLQLPVSNGKYVSSGAHSWTQVGLAGTQFVINRQRNTSTYTKFNMVQDMGNGQKCLVYCPGADGPTYVMKVPLTGI